jgi:hypothetical protein
LFSLISSYFGLRFLNVKKQALAGLFWVEPGFGQPGVRADLVYRGSVFWVVAKERLNQVLELRTEALAVYLLKVQVGLTGLEEIVEVLFHAGFFEREDAMHDDEEYNSKGEQIYFLTVVLFSLFNLWGHVGHGSSVALKGVDRLVAREPKVRHLKVQVVVHKDVFEF